MGRVAGKVAIITGAASGLGAADARLLAAEGAWVVLSDVNEALGREVSASIPGSLFLKHDVRDEDQWRSLIDRTMDHFGSVDVLVNNAGIVAFNSIEDTSLEKYRRINAVMSEGTFLGCKHVIPAMSRSGGGSIINMSSVAAIKGRSMVPSYAAAKGAILALTRSVAVHCQEKGYNIRCNAIVPGVHATPMTEAAVAHIPGDHGSLEQIRRGQGHPEDVAHFVLFLASSEARQITGTSMIIDQGETIR